MKTAEKKRIQQKTSIATNARMRIKPRGLVGMFKDRIVLNGTDDEVFSLNRLEEVE